MLKIWNEMCFTDKVLTLLFIALIIWACYSGAVQGMENAEQTYQTIISGNYY